MFSGVGTNSSSWGGGGVCVHALLQLRGPNHKQICSIVFQQCYSNTPSCPPPLSAAMIYNSNPFESTFEYTVQSSACVKIVWFSIQPLFEITGSKCKKVYAFISGNIAFHMHVFPIFACAIYYFITQLPTTLSRCHFALARCNLQRAGALLPTRRYAFANGPIRTPYVSSMKVICVMLFLSDL